MNRHPFRIFSYIIIVYMLMALLWWAILLQRNNAKIFHLEKERIEHTHQIDNTTSMYDEIEALKAKYKRQSNMIIGEAIVFGLTLALGIYFINRALFTELKAAEKQKNFLLSITHELKSPLASINLILETFVKRKLPDDKVKELSVDALTETNRLDNLFNKILLATRLKTSFSYHPETVDLSNFLERTVDKFKKIHPDINIKQSIQPEVIAHIDEESFQSVVQNLLENAVKYSHEEKEISIHLESNGDKAIIMIKDLGDGIPMQEKDKIFEQFYRIGSEETRKTKGTGLGLYIVREIVKAHSGKIKVLDNDPKGSIFKITLPLTNKNIT